MSILNENKDAAVEAIVAACKVMPVMVIEREADALPLAQALYKGGVKVLEITLRTAAALPAIRAIKQALPDCIVGAGTVIGPADVDAVQAAGVDFIVTPGTTAELRRALAQSGLPCLPGAATVSEMMALAEQGFHYQKFFPAVAAGGINYLKSVSGPLPQVKFCPTGGISPSSAPDFLALPNVVCVGGSWLAPAEVVSNGQWDAITQLAAESCQL